MIYCFLASLAIACSAPSAATVAQAPTPSPAAETPAQEGTSKSRKFVPVDSSTTKIEEKSVSLFSGFQAKTNSGILQRGGSADPLRDNREEPPNGATYYVFQLKAKERLKVRLQCESSGMVWMQFANPPVVGPMTAVIRRANMAPKVLRSKAIEVTNSQDSSCEVILIAFGMVNHAYSIQIERQSQ